MFQSQPLMSFSFPLSTRHVRRKHANSIELQLTTWKPRYLRVLCRYFRTAALLSQLVLPRLHSSLIGFSFIDPLFALC